MAVLNVGCTCAQGEQLETTPSTTATTTSTTEELPCGVDCATIKTPQCTMAVCNLGQEVGPLNTCIVVPLSKGAACDDGQFCTVDDACDDGACVGGGTSTCGLKVSPCEAVICYEESKTCDVTPVSDGASCTPTNLCQVEGVCQLGECKGQPKDCSFSPLSECNKVACDEATGKCVGIPDPTKNNDPCVLTGDLCTTGRTCSNGQCGGGSPKDCSALDLGCQVGECDPDSGACTPAPAAAGTICTEGLDECDVGACDNKGSCIASEAPDGFACNDHNACTKSDACEAGICGGGAVAGCVLYLNEGFETCPAGWTFGGDWQCGTPDNVGPLEAHTGEGVIATQIAGVYKVNQSFATTVADSPSFSLTGAVSPILSFWAWDHTEGGTFDGWNVKVSTDAGLSFSTVSTVTPPYNLMVNGQPAWGGNHSAKGWQPYSVNLSAYVGQQVILRFAFRSDAATVFPGVYIDDVVVAEPLQTPLYVTTPGPLPNVFAEQPFQAQMTRIGGTSNAVWSINPGGVNTAWLTIDPVTGLLSGIPSAADVGPVTVSVRVQEPMYLTNYADMTFQFTVEKAVYITSFEGACPNGWTLTGDWQCGVPMTEGPATAFTGAQCLATQIAGKYSNSQTFDGTTATSPDIDLTGIAVPKLSFRMWVATEGSDYDGFNLRVSSDGGATFAILEDVVPAYPLMIDGQPAWGGQDAALGWQLVQANLSAYAGQIIRLQLGFRSDSVGTYPGVYIDDILVN